ncbi:hypothetical protein NDU88_004518, partial [Pleurodeles waltl]
HATSLYRAPLGACHFIVQGTTWNMPPHCTVHQWEHATSLYRAPEGSLGAHHLIVQGTTESTCHIIVQDTSGLTGSMPPHYTGYHRKPATSWYRASLGACNLIAQGITGLTGCISPHSTGHHRELMPPHNTG